MDNGWIDWMMMIMIMMIIFFTGYNFTPSSKVLAAVDSAGFSRTGTSDLLSSRSISKKSSVDDRDDCWSTSFCPQVQKTDFITLQSLFRLRYDFSFLYSS